MYRASIQNHYYVLGIRPIEDHTSSDIYRSWEGDKMLWILSIYLGQGRRKCTANNMRTLSLPPPERGKGASFWSSNWLTTFIPICLCMNYAMSRYTPVLTVADERKPAFSGVTQLQSWAPATKSHRKRLQAKTTYKCESWAIQKKLVQAGRFLWQERSYRWALQASRADLREWNVRHY